MHKSFPISIYVCIFAILFSGCATTSNRNWGYAATSAPGWKRAGKAAKKSITSPYTWIPAVCALLATGFNVKTTEWATEKNPVFGSPGRADKISDRFSIYAQYSYFTSSLLTVSDDNFMNSLLYKTQGIIIGRITQSVNSDTTDFLKDTIPITRPNKEDYRSFPSGHTSNAAVYSMMTYRNIDYIAIPPVLRGILKAGALSLSATTAWARVEAKKHWLSDVFWGMALGNFIANFFYDSFLLDTENSDFKPVILLDTHGNLLAVFSRKF